MKQRTPEQVAIDAGIRVRELRRAAGLTQQVLAEKLDMTVQYLRRVESGRINLSVVSLVRFAYALGVEPSALLTAPENRAAPKRGRPPSRAPASKDRVSASKRTSGLRGKAGSR